MVMSAHRNTWKKSHANVYYIAPKELEPHMRKTLRMFLSLMCNGNNNWLQAMQPAWYNWCPLHDMAANLNNSVKKSRALQFLFYFKYWSFFFFFLMIFID